jgi:hypothetical protein
LKWSGQRITKTVPPFKEACNTGIMWSAPNTTKYVAFKTLFHQQDLQFHHSKLDDESISSNSDEDNIALEKIEDDNDDLFKAYEHKLRNTQKLLQYHQRMAHMPFKYIRSAAKQGRLPSRLANCEIPICPSCLYGKMSRRPWRNKSSYHPISNTTKPGTFFSVDQMESSIPGLIAQLKGIPTKERYMLATIFVDHATDFTFTFFQRDSSSVETLRAKIKFERFSRSHGVTITHYHAENVRFIDSSWWSDVRDKGQTMTLCGISAHHQNGKVERKIRHLQDLGRSSLLQAICFWPDAISVFLWPYAIRKAIDDLNHIPHPDQSLSPIELLSDFIVSPNLQHKHAFGCPMYILDHRL